MCPEFKSPVVMKSCVTFFLPAFVITFVSIHSHAVVYTFPLTSAEEVPEPSLGGATPSGTATVDINTTTGAISISGNYTGMTSSVNNAHLHGLAPNGVPAGVLLGLTHTGGTTGTISGNGTLSSSDLEGLLKGLTYINVHTVNNGPGEIRGQVESDDIRIFGIGLDPEQEVPAPNLGGATPSGSARIVVQVSTGDVEVTGDYDGMTSNVNNSHLHGLAPVGTPAGVLFGLTNSGGTSGTFSGTGTLGASDLTGLLSGQTYVNIHTVNNGPGEIRGQISDNKIRKFEIPLDPQQEVPAPTLNGATPSGAATVCVDIATGAATVSGSYTGLTSDVNNSHLHGLAGPGFPAGVIFGLTNTGGTTGTFEGSAILSTTNLDGVLAGQTYVNIHTVNNGPGEIRGQVEFQLAELPPIRLVPVLEDTFDSPVGITNAGDGSDRLFIVEQRGTIHIFESGALLPQPFLDIESKLVPERPGFDERGLLGLTFHPDYASSGTMGEGKFYVYYSALSPNETPPEDPNPVDHMTVIAEYSVSGGDPNLADAGSERVLLTFDQPQFNHDAGQIEFGMDQMLYIASGDGGSGDDNNAGHTGGSEDRPEGALGNSQDRSNLLGKILRIDPFGSNGPGGQYGIPADNPFVGEGGGVREEIWAYGLRNPWRFSFDDGPGGTGRLFCADVGQRAIEEVNIIEKGKNYGWRVFEGTFDFDPKTPATGPFEPPIAEYTRSGRNNGLQPIGRSITGGHVYRGPAAPTLDSLYIFGDWSDDFGTPNGTLLGLLESSPGTFQLGIFDVDSGNPIGSYLPALGRDEAGEIYIATKRTLAPSALDPNTNQPTGSIFRIATGCQIRHFEISLTADEEVPAPTLNGSTPSGSAVVEIDPDTGDVHISGTYEGMTSNVNNAHLHGLAPAGQPAGVVFGLTHTGGTSGTFKGSGTLSPAELQGFVSGLTYINVHTVNNGPGEIRGQIPGILAVDPRLSVEQSGNDVNICWEDSSRVLILEESTDLVTWAKSTLDIQNSGKTRCVTLPASIGNRFFRLR